MGLYDADNKELADGNEGLLTAVPAGSAWVEWTVRYSYTRIGEAEPWCGEGFDSFEYLVRDALGVESETVKVELDAKCRPGYHYVPDALFGLMYALHGLGFVLLLGCAAVVFKFKKHMVVKRSSGAFLFLILSGHMFGFLYGLLIGVVWEPADGSQETGTRWPCMALPWMMILNIQVVLGCLFAKSWRVYKLFSNVKLRRMAIPNSKLFKGVGMLLFPSVVVLLTWTAAFADEQQTQFEYPPNKWMTRAYCANNDEGATELFWVVSLSVCLVFVISTTVIAYKTRNVPMPSANEAFWLCLISYNILFVFMVMVPMFLMLKAIDPGAAYIMINLAVLWGNYICCGLLFVPKFLAIKTGKTSPAGAASTTVGPTSGQTKSTKG